MNILTIDIRSLPDSQADAVRALLACCVLDKTADRKSEFAYGAMCVDFLLKGA